jgi:MHS family shikimate/dehydroshikimate transporter-like MFS transporter
MDRVSSGALGASSTVEKERRRVLAASTFGTALEWYDFNLYGMAAALVFPALFFPETSLFIGTLASFATFAVGFVARPLGGIVFGHFGDRIGRKNVLIATLIVMGVATTLIGCLPTYSAIGLWAPALLIILRIAQGIGVGGEFAGATLLTIENAPTNRRGLYGAIPAMGTGAGFLLASAMFALMASFGNEALLDWGWRIPFLFSALLVVTGLLMRKRIRETPVFEKAKEEVGHEALPIVEAFTKYPGAIARTIGITVSGFVWAYLIQAFVYSYGTTTLGIPGSTLLLATAIAAALEVIFIPFWGWASDRVGRKPVVLGGLIFLAAYAWPFFLLLETGQTHLIILAMILAVPIGKDAVFGPQAALVAELFSTKVRYTGVSVGREVAGAIFGGTTPLIATLLFAASGQQIWSVVAFVLAAIAITFVTVATAPETNGRPLT